MMACTLDRRHALRNRTVRSCPTSGRHSRRVPLRLIARKRERYAPGVRRALLALFANRRVDVTRVHWRRARASADVKIFLLRYNRAFTVAMAGRQARSFAPHRNTDSFEPTRTASQLAALPDRSVYRVTFYVNLMLSIV